MSTIHEEAKRLIRKLSMPEKILLMEDLWDTIAAEESGFPMPKSHGKELDRRLKRFTASPGRLLSLEELRANIEKRK